jgi:hypothetical protein
MMLSNHSALRNAGRDLGACSLTQVPEEQHLQLAGEDESVRRLQEPAESH